MNPVASMDGFCEWPVASLFFDQDARSCGRAGYGTHVRLCWQHRENAWAQLVSDLHEWPDGRMSEHLADWFRSVETREHDTEEQLREREHSQRSAGLAIVKALEYCGRGDLPSILARHLDPIVEERMQARLTDVWGAA